MESPAAVVDFSKFSQKINENYVEHVRNLKELCSTKSVIKPCLFFENMQKEMSTLVTGTQEAGTVVDYDALFKAMEDYPCNLQKLPKKRELQRANSTILKGDILDCHTHTQSLLANTSATSINAMRLEEQRSARDVYSDFKNFQQKLRQFYDQAPLADKIQASYLSKLKQLQTFAQQLEKLTPAKRETLTAFTPEEETKLVDIAKNMEQLNSLRALCMENPNDIATGGMAAALLENLVDVLSYTLLQISCYSNA